jgi:serine protease Do
VCHDRVVKRVPLLLCLGVAFLAPSMALAQAPPTPPSLREISASFETLAARVRPAVVQIFSTGYAAARESDNGSNTALLSRETSTGSGVILTADGYIVTNNHVVEGARKIEVKLPTSGTARTEGMTVPAKVIGVDRETDLAVIKIEKTGLATLPLGDSTQLRQGELVMAFGNPRGLEGSMSMGIVSSTARQVKPDDAMVYIQTDAPINPGNSGGPLVNTDGRVVGINTFILTQSGGSEGLGFAVPSSVVRTVYDQIRKDGHVHRGHIGVSVESITPVLAKGLALSQDWGVLIRDLEPRGPAEAAGLEVGDIVQTLNGRPIETTSQMENAVYRLPLASTVQLTLLRDGKSVAATVPVHEQEDDPQRFADMVNPDDNLVPQLGVLAVELTPQLAGMLGDLRHDYGLVVAARSASAPYSGESLEIGDVIYQINREPTLSVKSIRETLAAMKSGDAVVLQVERAGRLLYLGLELE